jgi:two-component system OmpR family response regulator
MDPTIHVLVVDDHRDIRDLLSQFLSQYGLRVTTAAGGGEMKQALRTASIDLVVLDIMMPGEDGLSLCRHLRSTSQTPVILLTAVAEETDRIIGLEMGADDYLTKPFSPRELLARIKAVLRRTQSLPAQHPVSDEKIAFAHWVLDVARRELSSSDGVGVALSSAEFSLLTTFVNHPHRVLSRDQLLDLTRGREAVALDRSIDNQVSRLRRKIELDPSNPVLIKTVWGGGYLFTSDVTRT